VHPIIAPALAALAVFVLGCDGPPPTTAPPPPPQGKPALMEMGGGEQDICPMYVKSAEVAHHDVDDGCEMRFTAPPGGVDDLRGRVRAIAGFYRDHPVKGPGGARMPAAKLEVVDGDAGASIVFRAARPEDVATLRAHGRFHAVRLNAGHCDVGVSGCAGEQPMDPRTVAKCEEK
jgi:hypothetical protein